MDETEIRSKLRTKLFGRELHIYEHIGSTNDAAKKLPPTVPEGTVVLAEEQTSGRGRLGRVWHSVKGESLTFSVVIKPDIRQSHLGIISLYASLAVAEGIKDSTGLQPECKWPNDVLVGGKKCCGILSEATFVRGRCEGIIVGIGLNVNQGDFPGELSRTATSLRQAAGARYDVGDILSVLLHHMEKNYPAVQDGRYEEIRTGWLRYAPMIGKTVTISTPGASCRGIARRIEENGELVLWHGGKEERFSSGDLTLRIEA